MTMSRIQRPWPGIAVALAMLALVVAVPARNVCASEAKDDFGLQLRLIETPLARGHVGPSMTGTARIEVFIEAFSTRPRLLQDFTDSRMLLSQAIALLRPEGGTALYDAILEALLHIRQGRNAKKTLVIVSDGDDMNSYSSLEEAISAARRAGVLVYSIGITDRGGGGGSFQIGPFSLGMGGSMSSGYGDRILREIAAASGGTLFLMNENDVIANEPVLDDAIQTISRELRSQYSLGYSPTRSGSQYRRVRVEAHAKNSNRLTVRTQEGYALDSQEREEKARKIFQN